MYIYLVTFNTISHGTIPGVRFPSNCDTIERFIETFSPDMLVVCPDSNEGNAIVVNMRNVESMIIRKEEGYPDD